MTIALMAGPVLVVRLDAAQVLLDQPAARQPAFAHRGVHIGDGGFLDAERRGLSARDPVPKIVVSSRMAAGTRLVMVANTLLDRLRPPAPCVLEQTQWTGDPP